MTTLHDGRTELGGEKRLDVHAPKLTRFDSGKEGVRRDEIEIVT